MNSGRRGAEGRAYPTGSSRPEREPDCSGLAEEQQKAQVRSVERLADDGIVLRPWRREDAPAIVAGLQDGSAAEWIVGMPHPYGPAEAAAFLARAARELANADYAHLAVTDAAGGRVLGGVGLNLKLDRQAGEIGYWVAPPERGAGIALRAASLVMRWALQGLGLARVELIIHPDNHESQIIASRLGCRREGLLRSYLEHRGVRNDYCCFSRLPNDPDPEPHPVLRVPLTSGGTEATGDGDGDLRDVVLRPWRLRDAEVAVAAIADDPEIRRWCIGIPEPLDLAAVRQFIAEAARSWTEDRLPRFAITAGGGPENDCLLGSIGFAPPVRPGVGHLGYLVVREWRGRGVATATLSTVTQWAHAEGGLEMLELLIEPENSASIHVAERAGYTKVDGMLVRQTTPSGDAMCGLWRHTA